MKNKLTYDDTAFELRKVQILDIPSMPTIRVKDESNLLKLSKILNRPILHIENTQINDPESGKIVSEGMDSYWVINDGLRFMVIGQVGKKE